MPEKGKESVISSGISSGNIVWPLIIGSFIIGLLSLLIPGSDMIPIYLLAVTGGLGIFYFLYLVGTGGIMSNKEPGSRND